MRIPWSKMSSGRFSLNDDIASSLKKSMAALDVGMGPRPGDYDDSTQAALRSMLSARENRKKEPQNRVIVSDDLFVNKGDKVFEIEVEYDDKHHFKGLNYQDSNSHTENQPVKRVFSQPMTVKEMLETKFLLGSTVKGLQSQTYHSVHVRVVDPESKEPMHFLRHDHEWVQVTVWEQRKECEEELAIEMVKVDGKKMSILTVEEIDNFEDAAVELLRNDGRPVVVYFGGAKKVLSLAETTSEFLEKNYVRTYDLLFCPRTLMDYIFRDNFEYVHYFLFVSRAGENDFSVVSRKTPTGNAGLTLQVQFFKEVVSGVLFIILAINLPRGNNSTMASAPLCIPLHPQAQSGHIVVKHDGELRLQLAIFTNKNGKRISNNLVCTAGAKDGTASQDLDILASWDDIVAVLPALAPLEVE